MKLRNDVSRFGAPARPDLAPSASKLMNLVRGLAEGHPNRAFGTPEGGRAAQWVANQLSAAGCKPIHGTFIHDFEWPIGDELWTGQNVAGIVQGTDPQLKDEYIIVAAHHDSQQNTAEGANDNATGCAAVIALAEAFAKNPPKRSVVFLTFDGEEGLRAGGKYHAGRRGSRAYANEPIVPLEQTAMLVNMDMIGQVHLESGSRKDVFQWASNDAFAGEVLARAAKTALRSDERAIHGYPEQPLEGQFFTTDAEPLYRLNVPVLNFLSGRDLDNHHVRDDSSRIIPERIEQYTRLVQACVREAGNHERDLVQMGLRPGTAKSDYELIRARKATGAGPVAEESLRLGDVSRRLPEIRGLAHKLVRSLDLQALSEGAGVDLRPCFGGGLGEPAVAALRERLAEQAEIHRSLNKNDRAARREAVDRLRVLRGVTDVVAGAVFLDKLNKGGSYYLARVPEHLALLAGGARRLGMEAELAGVVQVSDVEAFLPEVSVDRAVSMAREALGELGLAAGMAARALLDPVAAADDPRPVVDDDLTRAMTRLSPAVGRAEPLEQGIYGFESLAIQLLEGIRGEGAAWLKRFRARHALTEIRTLTESKVGRSAGLDAAAQRLESAIESGEGLQAALVDFWSEAAGHSLPMSGPSDLREVVALGKERGREAFLGRAVMAPPPRERVRLFRAAIDLQALFHPRHGRLQPNVGLGQVHESLEALRDAAAAYEGGADVAQELRFWSTWLEPFLPLEGMARIEAERRVGAAHDAQEELRALWPAVAEKLVPYGVSKEALAKPSATRGELEPVAKKKRKKDEPKSKEAVAWSRFEPYLAVHDALRHLVGGASPAMRAQLREGVENLTLLLGEAKTAALGAATAKLEPAEGPGVKMGRNERSGPMRLLEIRR